MRATTLTGCVPLDVTAYGGVVGTVCVMSYSSDLTDEQWALLESVGHCAGQARTQARSGLAAGSGRDALRLPHRLPAALLA
jgi:GAF domain-containing protein